MRRALSLLAALVPGVLDRVFLGSDAAVERDDKLMPLQGAEETPATPTPLARAESSSTRAVAVPGNKRLTKSPHRQRPLSADASSSPAAR